MTLMTALRTQFDPDQWGQTPQVYRAAISPLAYPLETDRLLVLVEQERVESRAIDADSRLAFGPFDEAQSREILEDQSLLLVQCLEQHFPEMARLIHDEFNFMPAWQIDDVMGSFGNTGASCGAHFDQYDVFLFQHTGYKTWQLDAGGHQETDLDENSDVRLLKTFKPTTTFELGPGDVLYVPPGIGHYGLCKDWSVTLSVGVRNPSGAELFAELSEFVLQTAASSAPMEASLHPAGAALPGSVTDRLRSVAETMLNDDALLRWYGCYVTRLRDPDVLSVFETQTDNGAAMGNVSGQLQATLPSRLTYASNRQAIVLFVNGDYFDLPATARGWVEPLCATRQCESPIDPDSASLACIEDLLTSGAVQQAAATNE